MQLLKNITLTVLLGISSLSAHSLWVNSFESFSHKPGHTILSIGWGHTMPISDMINTSNTKVILEDFTIQTPEGKIIQLNIPSNEETKPSQKIKDFEVYESSSGFLKKIKLNKHSSEGIYKIALKTEPTYYTRYKDIKDRQRFKLKAMNQLKDIKDVEVSVKYQAFATTYLSLGDWWEKPKATKKGLEIIPLTDLSNIKVGDFIEFEILFYGEPLHSGAKNGTQFITANSPSFGQSHNFALFSKIKNGKAQFIVQSAGQWKIECSHTQDVTKNGKLKDEYGKAKSVFHGSTLTFNVKE